MRGAIFNIKKFALHDGPGIRTTVFMKGCALKCWWCHNPESIRKIEKINGGDLCSDEANVKFYTPIELFQIIKKDRMFYEESGGGVTFSGGEPMLQTEFINEIFIMCKKEDINTTVDTSGFITYDKFEEILPVTDLFLYDLKLMNDEDHIKFTGISNIPIKKNLQFLLKDRANVIIRIPLIPGITDTPQNINATVEFLSGLNGIKRIDLLPYNELYEAKYTRTNTVPKLKGLISQTNEELIAIKEKFTTLKTEITFRG